MGMVKLWISDGQCDWWWDGDGNSDRQGSSDRLVAVMVSAVTDHGSHATDH